MDYQDLYVQECGSEKQVTGLKRIGGEFVSLPFSTGWSGYHKENMIFISPTPCMVITICARMPGILGWAILLH